MGRQLVKQILLFASLLLPFKIHADIHKNKFTDKATGFSISKPADWGFVEAPKAHGLKLKDETQMKAQNKTLVTFTKAQDKNFFGVRPTVGVERLKLPPNTGALEWLTDEMKRQADQNKYYVSASPASATAFDEVTDGARAAYVNSTVIDGVEIRVYHVLYVVPSGKQVLLVHMNCNENLGAEYVGIFGKIADTIEAKEHF